MNHGTDIPEGPADPAAGDVPGGVYLCQVDELTSCGACCGLYNYASLTRGELQALIAYRTERFRQVPRNEDAITDFQMEMERRESQRQLYAEFYRCPFLGFIGLRGSRVGCLLHPAGEGNGGIDWRGLSFYGGMACRTYFCPSHRGLPAAFKNILKSVLRGWYLYGLVVTEERMLAACCAEIERRLGRPLCAADAALRPAGRAALLRLLGLKLGWPFRDETWQGPANYFFNDDRYPRPPIDYRRLSTSTSAHDAVLRELSSFFRTRQELRSAESTLDALYARIVAAIGAPEAPPASIDMPGRPVL
jgi:hypothetical protein